MRITLTTLDGKIYPIEVSIDIEIMNLKALCEQETNIPTNEMSLTFNGIPLNDDARSLSSYSLKDNDLIMVQRINKTSSSLPFIDFSSISVPRPSSASSSNTTSTYFEFILSNI
jgi:DNA damage-inducible protein 1